MRACVDACVRVCALELPVIHPRTVRPLVNTTESRHGYGGEAADSAIPGLSGWGGGGGGGVRREGGGAGECLMESPRCGATVCRLCVSNEVFSGTLPEPWRRWTL